jgi:copper chaperone CopZ
MTTTRFAVSGMTCGACLAEVLEELHALDGVQRVRVDLVGGGLSPVQLTSEKALDASRVRAAVQRAGFVMAEHLHSAPMRPVSPYRRGTAIASAPLSHATIRLAEGA